MCVCFSKCWYRGCHRWNHLALLPAIWMWTCPGHHSIHTDTPFSSIQVTSHLRLKTDCVFYESTCPRLTDMSDLAASSSALWPGHSHSNPNYCLSFSYRRSFLWRSSPCIIIEWLSSSLICCSKSQLSSFWATLLDTNPRTLFMVTWMYHFSRVTCSWTHPISSPNYLSQIFFRKTLDCIFWRRFLVLSGGWIHVTKANASVPSSTQLTSEGWNLSWRSRTFLDNTTEYTTCHRFHLHGPSLSCFAGKCHCCYFTASFLVLTLIFHALQTPLFRFRQTYIHLSNRTFSINSASNTP